MKQKTIDLSELLNTFMSPGTKALVVILKATEREEEEKEEQAEKFRLEKKMAKAEGITEESMELYHPHYNSLFLASGAGSGSGSLLTVVES